MLRDFFSHVNPNVKTTILIEHVNLAYFFLPFFETVLKRMYPSSELIFAEESTVEPDILLIGGYGPLVQRTLEYKKCLKILLSAETKNIAKYAADIVISTVNQFERCIRGPSHIYIPYCSISFDRRIDHSPRDLLAKKDITEETIDNKIKFCGFLYSQPSQYRDAFFDKLNQYQKVDALGKSKGDPTRSTRTVGDTYEEIVKGARSFLDLAVESYMPYKFAITFENSDTPGYVTEKIVSAMLSNAIPIYWGSDEVNEIFNPNSFINVKDFESIEACIAYILKVDSDKELFLGKLKQSWISGDELPYHFSWHDDCGDNYFFRQFRRAILFQVVKKSLRL